MQPPDALPPSWQRLLALSGVVFAVLFLVGWFASGGEPTTTPTGVAIFAEDFQTIRKLAERDHEGIVSWNRYERGSHFAPQDAPDLLLVDIRRFFRDLR